MTRKAVVLGCGLVGATIARDMAADPRFEVTAFDASAENLRKLADVPRLTPRQADLGTPDGVRVAVADADVVLGAMPSALGLMVLRTVIESGKPFADISFMAEDATQLSGLAREKGVTAVVDCGVAPGLANLAIGHSHAHLDRTDRVVYYVGGLPKQPSWPYLYKAPFAPSDVIEEYTRPARMVENGKVVAKPAMSDPERLSFPPVGELEAFNTDGLRSLLDTIACPHMVEKTLRYPGHIELMAVLRQTGFFKKEEIDVRGVRVRPLDVTAKLLFPMWTYQPGEEEFTILRVIVEGEKGGRPQRHVYDLYDEYDHATKQSSMARTTGFPCAIVARILSDGEITEPGVQPPEILGRRPGMMDRMIEELARRGVHLKYRVE
ncbi:MAG: saccharopine dehydrogenase [Planctomycetota bacterium]|nr:MAG: saccharopine dehydrogenase [Planctomycetota bacterium]